jgi:acetyl-CoA carboxylase biotin carboxyl carrier protein
MELERIKALIAAMAESDLAEMEFSENGWTLRLVRGGLRGVTPTVVPVPRAAMAPVADDGDVQAPLAGVVHLRPAPDAAPFVTAGQTVAPGEVLCLIEAMKVFNSVRAAQGGSVAEILVASGSEVEAGQSLMRIV